MKILDNINYLSYFPLSKVVEIEHPVSTTTAHCVLTSLSSICCSIVYSGHSAKVVEHLITLV